MLGPATLRPVGLGLLIAGLLAASVAPAQVVKCVDAKGRVEYAKTCPPGTTEAARIQRDPTPPPATPPRSGPAPAGYATATEVTPDQLDNAEFNVCGAASGLASAKAGLDQKDSLPVEELAGPINDPRRREALQQRLDAGLQSAQRDMVASQAADLARYQAEYRRLTGSEFNTALCSDKQRRIKRREAWEVKRRDELLQKQADHVVSNEAEGIRAICQQKRAMDGPPKDWAQALPVDQVREIQESGRTAYVRLVASYERAYNRRFDPARCP